MRLLVLLFVTCTIYNELRLKWRQMKESFVEYVRWSLRQSSDQIAPVSTPAFYGQLKFLMPIVGQANQSAIDMENREAIPVPDLQDTQHPEPGPRSFTGSRNRNVDMEECETHLFAPKQWKEQKLIDRENDDYYFYRSLLPFLQKLNEDQKMMFRIDAMKLVRNYTQSSPQCLQEQLNESNMSFYERSSIFRAPAPQMVPRMTPQMMPQQMDQMMPQQVEHMMPQQPYQMMPQHVQQVMPQQVYQMMPQQAEQKMAQQAEHKMAQLVDQMFPQQTQQIMPQQAYQMMPQLAQQMIPQQSHHMMPQQVQQMMPQQAQHMMPQHAQQMMPQQAQHMMPQQAQHMMPQQAQHMMPQQAQHMMPQQAQHMMPQMGYQMMPQTTSQQMVMTMVKRANRLDVPPSLVHLLRRPISPRVIPARIDDDSSDDEDTPPPPPPFSPPPSQEAYSMPYLTPNYSDSNDSNTN